MLSRGRTFPEVPEGSLEVVALELDLEVGQDFIREITGSVQEDRTIAHAL